jgi:hypothetical protein
MAVLKYYNTTTSAWEYIAASTTANFTSWKKTASGGETSVSGTDDNAVTLSYTVGLEQVFINGVLQVRGADYVATTGTSITGLTALVANDIVTVVCYAPFNVANTIAPTVVDAKGDLIAGTAADTVGRLEVGSNNQILVADSSTSTGLKWAQGSLGDIGYISATNITNITVNTDTTLLTLTPTITAGRLYKATGNAAFQNPNVTGSRALWFEETSQSLRRTLKYDTVSQSSNTPWNMNGSMYFTAAEVGVTSGSATKTCLLRFRTNASGVYTVTNPDAIVGTNSSPQQFIIEDIGAA